jgi:hypothetical protein
MGHTKVWWVNIFGTDLGVPKKNMTISPKNVIDRFYKIKIKTWKENYIIFSEKGDHEIYDETLEYAKTSDHEIYILGGHGLPNTPIISNSLKIKTETIDAIEILRRMKKLGFAPEKSKADIKLASCFSGVGGNKNSLAGQFREKIDYECQKIRGYKGRVYGYTKSLRLGYKDLSNKNKVHHKWVSKKYYLCGCIEREKIAGRWSQFRKQFDSDKKILDELDKLNKSEKMLYPILVGNKSLLYSQKIKLLKKTIKSLEKENSLLRKRSNIPEEKKKEIIKK